MLFPVMNRIIYGYSRGGVLVSFTDPNPLCYISIVELGLGTRLVVIYMFQAVCRAVYVLNVSTCI